MVLSLEEAAEAADVMNLAGGTASSAARPDASTSGAVVN
jgi:hypothetical protein